MLPLWLQPARWLAESVNRGKKAENRHGVALTVEISAGLLAGSHISASKLAGKKAAASCTHSKTSLRLPFDKRLAEEPSGGVRDSTP